MSELSTTYQTPQLRLWAIATYTDGSIREERQPQRSPPGYIRTTWGWIPITDSTEGARLWVVLGCRITAFACPNPAPDVSHKVQYLLTGLF